MFHENIVETEFVEKESATELKKGFKEAEELLQDTDKCEQLLQRIEKKLKAVPKLGNHLATIPTFIAMVRNYIRKEYTDAPLGTIIAIVSALLYFVSPIDIIPDALPGVGHIDDAFVVTACLALVNDDVQEYLRWRDKSGKTL